MPLALVTGIAGQDGAYLARRLRSEGCHVIGLKLPGSLDPALEPFLSSVELVDVDLTDESSLAAVLDRSRPDEIYNLAGLSSVALSWQEPVLTSEINGVAVVRLLELIRRYPGARGPARFLQASSAEIFGSPEHSPQDESSPLAPVSPYGLAKAFAHQAVGIARAAHGLHASTVILYNHESPLRPASFVTRKITRAAAAISLGLETELALGTLDISRDWGFAGDYVDAMVRAVRHDVPSDYVVATGLQHTLRDLLDVAFRRAGIQDWAPYVRTDPDLVRPAEITAMVGDATRARTVLGWEPSTSFAELVSRMVDADLALLRPGSQP